MTLIPLGMRHLLGIFQQMLPLPQAALPELIEKLVEAK
jgi:hypothetical protein